MSVHLCVTCRGHVLFITEVQSSRAGLISLPSVTKVCEFRDFSQQFVVRLLWCLRRADPTSRGILPSVVCLWSRNFNNEARKKIFHGFKWLSVASGDELFLNDGGERSGPTATDGQTRKYVVLKEQCINAIYNLLILSYHLRMNLGQDLVRTTSCFTLTKISKTTMFFF